MRLGRYFGAVLPWLFAFALSGCGAHNFSARGNSGGVTTSASTISPSAALAECNNVTSSIGVTGQVSTYYQAGQIVPSDLLLNLTAVPSQLYSSSTAYVEIVPYSETTSGVVSYGSAAGMMFMDKLTGLLTTSEYSNLSLSTIQAAMKQLNLTSSISTSDFFNRVYVLLLGMDYSYDAASVEYFDSTESSNALSTSNFLLPIFYANPTVYEQYKPVANLEQLHPFWSDLSSGYSDAQFGQMDNQICQEMSGGGRIPASVGSMDGVDMVSAAKYLKGFLHTPSGVRLDHSGFIANFWSRYCQPIWAWVAHWLSSF